VRALVIGAAGYDPGIVARLPEQRAGFFLWASGLALGVSIGAALGVFYGGWLAVGSWWPAAIAGAVAGPVVLNLFRMQHAGTGYPTFQPIEHLPWWQPSLAGALVFFFLGAMLLQPLVLLAMRPIVGPGVAFGLISQTHATWDFPLPTLAITALFAAVMSSPSWLRFVFVESVRAYERERWIDERMLIDDAFADAQDLVYRALLREPRFSGRLQLHFADPPYNTQPIWFGVDPRDVERDRVKYTKPIEPEEAPPPPVAPPPEPRARRPERAPAPQPVPAQAAPEPAPAPAPEPEPMMEVPAPTRPDDEVVKEDAPLFAWDDSLDTGEPPDLAYADVGRLPAGVARKHTDDVVPFITEYTGRPEAEVRGLLRAAPDDMPMDKLFSEYTSLKVILMKDAGFALDHGFGRILSIVVDKPVDEVERRLRAAPPDRRLTGVFTSELARRILGKKV
jgi:hypothetical protein